MTNEESKRRLAINFKLKMCFSLNWNLTIILAALPLVFKKFPYKFLKVQVIKSIFNLKLTLRLKILLNSKTLKN